MIEKYLRNELSAEEVREFEKQLQESPSLRKQLAREGELFASFDQVRRERLREHFKDLDRGRQGKAVSRTMTGNTWLKWAATVAALLIVGYLGYLNLNRTNPSQLYEEYYKPYPNVVEPVTRDNGSSTTAYVHYEKAEYEQALTSFGKLLDEDPGHVANRFYYAMTSMILENDDVALEVFESLAMEDSDFRDQATWYISLLYLRQNNEEGARPYLQQLVDRNTTWGDEASEILKRL